jgi:hypothetical protein
MLRLALYYFLPVRLNFRNVDMSLKFKLSSSLLYTPKFKRIGRNIQNFTSCFTENLPSLTEETSQLMPFREIIAVHCKNRAV